MFWRMSKGQCQFVRPRWLWFRLVCGLLLLLLSLFRPWRHDGVHARVRDGLAEVLSKVSRDHDESAAQRGLAVEHFLRLVGIGFVEGGDGAAKMREGIFQRLEHFCFVSRESADRFGVKARRRRGAECPSNAVVCSNDMGQDFTYRANALSGTPGVLFRGHGFGQASVSLFVISDLFQEFGSVA